MTPSKDIIGEPVTANPYYHRRTYVDPPGAYKCSDCGYVTTNRSGHPASVGFGSDCPAAMSRRIKELERDRDDAIVRLGRLVQTDAQRLAEVDLIRREMRDAVDAVDSMSTRLYQRTAEVERLTRELESIRVRSTEACKGTGLSPANAGIVPEIVAILADRLRVASDRIAALEAHEASLHKYGAWVRGEIVRWLAEMAQVEAREHRPMFATDALLLAANAITAGTDAAWCEAHPVSPAPEDTP